jgi:hypothetical protein
MAVNYYSAKSGDWDSPVWTLNPLDKNVKLIKLPETLSDEDRLIVRHHIKNTNQLVNLGEKIRAPILVENGAKLEIEGNLRLNNYSLSNECKIEIHKNLYLNGSSNICGAGDLAVGGHINKNDNAFICSNVPIELEYFEATYLNDGVLITWQSLSIIKDLKFELQKSYDGINFEKMTIVDNDIISENHHYAFLDKDSKENSEMVYYRLKQIDNTERFNYSEIYYLSTTTDISFNE